MTDEGLVRDGRPLFHFQTIQMATHLLQYIVRFIQLFAIDKRVIIMLKNNIEVDVKVKCIENEKTQAELAKEISITPSYVNRLIRKNENVVNKTFLAMMEALGYDVTLVYEKRDR
jgi:predicted XRE-type DNA-binding protein